MIAVGDRPTKVELIEAVRRFLEQDLLPRLEGVQRFHALVAANALGIAGRELELEGLHQRARRARLAALLADASPAPPDLADVVADVDRMEGELCTRIRGGFGDAAPERERLLDHLLVSVRERLAVSNPGYR